MRLAPAITRTRHPRHTGGRILRTGKHSGTNVVYLCVRHVGGRILRTGRHSGTNVILDGFFHLLVSISFCI